MNSPYIKVTRDGTSYGNYSLSTIFTPISPLTTNDIEPNNTSATATSASLNTAVTGQLGYIGGGQGTSADTQDWWKIIIPQYGPLTLHVYINSTLDLDWSGIKIFASDGITVLEDIDGPWGGTNTEGSYGPFSLSAGTYFIRFTRYGTSYGVYSLNASMPGPPTTSIPNDTTTTTSIHSTTTTSMHSTTTTTTSGGGGCPFTSVLGEDNPKLENLRDFRDSSLAKSAVGRKIIQIYYNNAESINAALESSPALRAVTRTVLEVIAPMVGKN